MGTDKEQTINVPIVERGGHPEGRWSKNVPNKEATIATYAINDKQRLALIIENIGNSIFH